jgi:hypothetical protein
MEVYRKSTATDVTINNKSFHPKQHKLSAYRNWINRLLALPLRKRNRKKELNTIFNIDVNNGYRKEDIIHIYNKLKYQKKNPNNNTEIEQQKWITFTYTGNYTCSITKLFKDTSLNVAFKTTSTLNIFLTNKQKTNIYKQSGIYKKTCQSCYKVYIGQTGRNLRARYKEHLRNTKNNKDESAFAQHILNTGHKYGPMEQIKEMDEGAKKVG